jgi:hypothetical protein
LGEGTSKAAAGFFNPALFAIIDHRSRRKRRAPRVRSRRL